MNDCAITNFFCGLLAGLFLGFCVAAIAMNDDYEELKQFREEKAVNMKLKERGCL